MSSNWWTKKGFVFAAAMAVLACTTALVAFGVAYPEKVSNTALGPDWHCSRVAFIWTTCSRQKHAEAAPARSTGEPVCRRQRALEA